LREKKTPLECVLPSTLHTVFVKLVMLRMYGKGSTKDESGILSLTSFVMKTL